MKKNIGTPLPRVAKRPNFPNTFNNSQKPTFLGNEAQKIDRAEKKLWPEMSKKFGFW